MAPLFRAGAVRLAGEWHLRRRAGPRSSERSGRARGESGMRCIHFWFDFASTYSYVAAMRVEELCSDAGVALAWQPFLLGPIFKLQGWDDSPFNLNERRGAYMW